ncbi:bacillithiol biosynthesis cysteine-adding enzyme BshC [Sporosarcina trichiuri]|uniref:bacillithiol biosynthesis cysteine-adding enzyme BshC n=1 Tax=Sporosarcina trichiuri TaxID=3056445 RepID=UPI0025B32D22|nr:bacillithiol biosynthesis cysteine-adding enzyme BshC [Sporosarcina sp. 0.2-SM1T-5]WJY28823.1 bacillithiol biosynthesis cysteine-adding enzyme BshC [Sporosarcina sp. 0.2-SM1T-5]
MKIASHPIHKNKIMESYGNDQEFAASYFDYGRGENDFSSRLEELDSRMYQRKELTGTIRNFLEPYGISESQAANLKALEDGAVAVVGGQQAGLLTGPLYSVHKAITVILLARQQQVKLGVPIVPVFWIAGEDHDIDEINHIYAEQDGRPLKRQYPERFVLKTMASETVYSQEQMAEFIRLIFRDFGETVHTKQLLADVLEAAEHETTFTGFFVRLMNGLFKEHGLLMIDAADRSFRELEKDHFKQFIRKSAELAASVAETESRFSTEGYGAPIEASGDAAHLFYVHETGRVLLSRKDGLFVNEAAGLRFTEEELLAIAEKTPWLLSNNVATRPIMQDLMLPVLAFVGGPGEIAYWALLKPAFRLFGIKMPIVVPRISITLVTRNAQHALEKTGLTVDRVLAGETIIRREQFLDEQRDEGMDSLLGETVDLLTVQYAKIQQHLGDTDLGALSEKNLGYHLRQVEFLREKTEDALLRKYAAALGSYNLLEGDLYPERNLQERTYTPFKYLNEYGPSLIRDLLAEEIPSDGSHVIIYL